MPPIDPTSECEHTGLEVQMCAHCREKGIYKPASSGKKKTLNLEDIDVLQTSDLSIDEAGEVWVNPNEAFLRGEFGHGRYRY